MPNYRRSALLVTTLAAFSLVGCAVMPGAPAAPPAEPGVGVDQEVDTQDGADETAGATAGEVSIPAGARAATPDFPFPVPEGWTILDDFVPSDVSDTSVLSGSVEYPGDAQVDAAHYKELLIAGGWDAYTNVMGELTNEAALFADGIVDGQAYIAMLSFDSHADGYQRVWVLISTN